VLTLSPGQAQAQYSGANTKGDFGIQSGSQAAPGFYAAAMYLHYGGDSLRDRDGNPIAIDPERGGNLSANGLAPGIVYTSNFEILGGTYGFMAFPALTNNALEIPILGQESRSDTGFGDLYLQPINLGGGWAVGSAPLLTANWKAESGNKWTIPWGLQISKVTKVASQPVNLLLGYYANSEHPEGSPDKQVRFQINFMFPTAKR